MGLSAGGLSAGELIRGPYFALVKSSLFNKNFDRSAENSARKSNEARESRCNIFGISRASLVNEMRWLLVTVPLENQSFLYPFCSATSPDNQACNRNRAESLCHSTYLPQKFTERWHP